MVSSVIPPLCLFAYYFEVRSTTDPEESLCFSHRTWLLSLWGLSPCLPV